MALLHVALLTSWSKPLCVRKNMSRSWLKSPVKMIPQSGWRLKMPSSVAIKLVHAAVVRVGWMVYACDNDACESSWQFVESHSYPQNLVYVVFCIKESVICHCRCYVERHSSARTSYPVLLLTAILKLDNIR